MAEDTKTFSRIINQSIRPRGKWTPDFGKLRNREWVPLFLFDGFKRSGPFNKYLKESGARYMGEGRTATEGYEMFRRDNKGPIILESERHYSKAQILGEVYGVTPEFILFLDKLKFNTLENERKIKNILMLDQSYWTNDGTKRPYLQCFLYVGVPEYWNEREDMLTRSTMVTEYKGKDDSTRKKYYTYK